MSDAVPRAAPDASAARPEGLHARVLLTAHAHPGWQLFVLAASYVVYVVYWSWITIQRFYSLNAYVYDLGSNTQGMWVYWHQSWTPVQVVAEVFDHGIQYLISPITLLSSYPALLIFQSIFVGSACFAVYGISQLALKNRTESLLIGLSYLVFFPLAGANWLDFEFIGMFAPLFLFGYLALERRQFVPAAVLLLLAGLIRFPFAIFPLMLAGTILLPPFLRWSGSPIPGHEERRFAWSVAVASAVMLAVGYLVSVPVIYGGNLATNLHVSGAAGPPVGTYDLLLTLVLLVAPLLFLPLFSPKWILFLVPYAALLFYSGYWAYSYPYAFRWQYAPTLVPFVYLGTIDCLAHPRLLFGDRWLRRSSTARSLYRAWPRRTRRAVVLTLFLVIAVSALFLEPYGPFNGGTFNNYSLTQNTAVNETQWSALNSLVAMIPPNDPYILFQDNMPEVLPRPQPYPTMLVPGLGTFGYPLTAQEAVAGSFPMVQWGQWTTVRVDYVLSDPFSWTYSYGLPSMADFVTALYGSGAYGILGEADGFLLLEHNFTGPIQYYRPYAQVFGPTQLFQVTDGPPFTASPISVVNSSGDAPLWNGPFNVLSPGTYSVNLSMETSDTSPHNRIQLQVLAGPQASTVLQLQSLTGSNFSAPGSWQSIRLEFYASLPLSYVQVIARSLGWNGTISLRSITMSQLAAGPPTFRAGFSVSDDIFYRLIAMLSSSGSVVVQPGFQYGLLGRPVWTSENYSPNDSATYLIGDPYDAGFSCASCSGSSSMVQILNASLASGEYGVWAEDAGEVVLERGYSGPPQLFVPFALSFDPTQLYQGPSGPPFNSSVIVTENTSGNLPLWDGPFSFLIPGSYTVGFWLESSSLATSNRLLLQVLAGPTAQVVLTESWLYGSNFTSPDVWQNVTVNFTTLSAYDYAQYIGRSFGWAGSLDLRSIVLHQLAP